MAIGNARDPLDTLGEFFSWEKDKGLRYTKCSESYAEAAGLDSPSAIIGKTDFQMPWRELAPLFREGDQALLDGQTPFRLFSQEKEIAAYGPMDILVNERPLVDRAGRRVGVTGHFQNITGHVLVPRGADRISNIAATALKPDSPHFILDGRLHLQGKFGNLILTKAETEILRYCWRGYSSKEIGRCLAKSFRTVEAQFDTIRKKLQCKTKGDLIQLVTSEGLHLTFLSPQLALRPTDP